MNAIRQIVEVKNHKLNIELPENFDAEYAEVIIFPKEEELDLNDVIDDIPQIFPQLINSLK